METSFHHRKGPRPSGSAIKEGAHSLRKEIQREIQGESQREIGEYCNRDVSGLAKFSGSCFGI